MGERRDRGRELRALWATLAAICLLGAGVAYGVTRYVQSQLEREAVRDARRLATDVLRPMLLPADALAPVHGERYEELLASVQGRVLGGTINGVRLYRNDGTILFSDDPDLVGRREPEVRDEIHAVVGGASQGIVDGGRYRMLTALKLAEPPVIVAAELDRSHAAIVEESRERWYPWVSRALVAAAVCAALWVATWLFAAVLAASRRMAARRRSSAPARAAATPRAPTSAREADLPAYMVPGFQQEVEARRRLEEELSTVRQERDSLLSRVRQLEAELESARGALDGAPSAGRRV